MNLVKRAFLCLCIIALAASPALGQQKVKLAQVSHSLSFTPVYVAMDRGFFGKEGIEIEWQRVRGGAAGKAAISGGSVNFCACAGNDLLSLVMAKMPVVGIHGIATSVTMDISVSRKYAAQRKVTKESPLRARIRALKGANMGVISLGGAPDLYSRWLIGTVGLDPSKDINNIRVGGHAERTAAFNKGHIDGFMTGPPLGFQMQMEGKSIILISPREVPEYKDFIHEVLIVRKDYAESDPQTVGKMGRALARANNFVQDNTAQTKKVLEKRFARFDPKIISAAMDNVKTYFGRDGRMTETMWKNAITVNLEWRGIKGPSTKEGEWWTNKFLSGS